MDDATAKTKGIAAKSPVSGDPTKPSSTKEEAAARIEAAKLETALKQREEFLSVCAHDLRSPLGLIRSSIGLLLNSKEHSRSLTDFQREILLRAERQAVHGLNLVKDLLDVMAFEQGLKPQYQLLDIDALLKEVVGDFRFQAAQKKIQVHYENRIADWKVLADSERLRQLLQNILTNALKFTEQGKNIHLAVTPFQGRRKSDPPHPMMILSLKDEGPGIPQEELTKIFDRFNQIKEYSRTEGRGLGLSVAKQISNLHDGNIWAESKPGDGATFHFLIPHAIRPIADAFVPAMPPKKILAVEPDNSVRQSSFEPLRQSGIEVLYAKDGVESITLLFHFQPDLVILNPQVKKLAASEVTKITKADRLAGRVPVLLTSSDAHAAAKLDKVVADGVLPVPFTREQLEQAIQGLQEQTGTRKKVA